MRKQSSALLERIGGPIAQEVIATRISYDCVGSARVEGGCYPFFTTLLLAGRSASPSERIRVQRLARF
jgi:hypothetical protein